MVIYHKNKEVLPSEIDLSKKERLNKVKEQIKAEKEKAYLESYKKKMLNLERGRARAEAEKEVLRSRTKLEKFKGFVDKVKKYKPQGKVRVVPRMIENKKVQQTESRGDRVRRLWGF